MRNSSDAAPSTTRPTDSIASPSSSRFTSLEKGKGRELECIELSSDDEGSNNESLGRPADRVSQEIEDDEGSQKGQREQSTYSSAQKRKRHPPWSAKELQMLCMLVEDYDGQIDYEKVAEDLAELVPMADGLRRTATACAVNYTHLRKSGVCLEPCFLCRATYSRTRLSLSGCCTGPVSTFIHLARRYSLAQACFTIYRVFKVGPCSGRAQSRGAHRSSIRCSYRPLL